MVWAWRPVSGGGCVVPKRPLKVSMNPGDGVCRGRMRGVVTVAWVVKERMLGFRLPRGGRRSYVTLAAP